MGTIKRKMNQHFTGSELMAPQGDARYDRLMERYGKLDRALREAMWEASELADELAKAGMASEASWGTVYSGAAAAANRIALDLERVIGSDMDGFSYPEGSWA